MNFGKIAVIILFDNTVIKIKVIENKKISTTPHFMSRRKKIDNLIEIKCSKKAKLFACLSTDWDRGYFIPLLNSFTGKAGLQNYILSKGMITVYIEAI